jgi:hypothetical protein
MRCLTGTFILGLRDSKALRDASCGMGFRVSLCQWVHDSQRRVNTYSNGQQETYRVLMSLVYCIILLCPYSSLNFRMTAPTPTQFRYFRREGYQNNPWLRYIYLR